MNMCVYTLHNTEKGHGKTANRTGIGSATSTVWDDWRGEEYLA